MSDKQERARNETLAIPARVRLAVDERDTFHCRVCGRFLGEELRAHHHIIYGGTERGMGGRRVHNPDEIVTVGWHWPGCTCHDLVHSNKRLWQPILLAIVNRRGVTALQYQRWQSAAQHKTRRNK